MLQAALRHLLIVDEQERLATRPRFGRVGPELEARLDRATRQGRRYAQRVKLHAQQAVGVLQLAVLHVECKAAQETAIGNYDALDPALGNLEIGTDGVGAAVHMRD